jgi:hypothetical protein
MRSNSDSFAIDNGEMLIDSRSLPSKWRDSKAYALAGQQGSEPVERLVGDLLGQRVDMPVGFGQRNELVRHDHAMTRMLPASKRLKTGYRAGTTIDARLIGREELMTMQRLHEISRSQPHRARERRFAVCGDVDTTLAQEHGAQFGRPERLVQHPQDAQTALRGSPARGIQHALTGSADDDDAGTTGALCQHLHHLHTIHPGHDQIDHDAVWREFTHGNKEFIRIRGQTYSITGGLGDALHGVTDHGLVVEDDESGFGHLAPVRLVTAVGCLALGATRPRVHRP